MRKKIVSLAATLAVALSLAACDFRGSGTIECSTKSDVTTCTGRSTPLTSTPVTLVPTATQVPTEPTKTVSPTSTTAPPTTTNPPTAVRPYFGGADWLWNKIPASPRLDVRSSSLGAQLGQGKHVADTIEYGVTLRGSAGITSSTPRYDVKFSQQGNWGPDPFSNNMPVPDGMTPPPGSDGEMSVADPVTGQVYGLYVARKSGAGWSADWGGQTPLAGDGREHGGSSTGTGLSNFAATVRADEIAKGVIPHALFFSTDIARGEEVRYPAVKHDGHNDTGSGIPWGARIQLDPSIDLSKIPGITPGELTVGRALQTYGAYVGDNGGARAAFIFEHVGSSSAANKVYSDAGITGDYYGFPHIPWTHIRVLAQWDGR